MAKQHYIADYKKDGFTISTDNARLDLQTIYNFLNSVYWAKNISLAIVKKSIENSLCFGVYNHENELVGFARVVSDYATFAWLADVFILEKYRARGLAKWLIECIINHPELQGLRRWMLATRNAHGLYAKYEFKPLLKVETFMEIYRPNIYEIEK